MHYFNFFPCSRYGRSAVRNESYPFFITSNLFYAPELDFHNKSIKTFSKERHLKKRKYESRFGSNLPSCFISSICQTVVNWQSTSHQTLMQYFTNSKTYFLALQLRTKTYEQLAISQISKQSKFYMKKLMLSKFTFTINFLEYSNKTNQAPRVTKSLNKIIFVISSIFRSVFCYNLPFCYYFHLKQY